jgi:cell division ATPase FtsA
MVLPVAEKQFINNIAVGLHITLIAAEWIKLEHGCVYTLLFVATTIEVKFVQSTENQLINSKDLLDIIELCAVELVTLIYKDIRAKALFQMMRSRLVLTDDVAMRKSLSELARTLFSLPVRIEFL